MQYPTISTMQICNYINHKRIIWKASRTKDEKNSVNLEINLRNIFNKISNRKGEPPRIWWDSTHVKQLKCMTITFMNTA